jgi:hypothetical protein
MLLQSCRHDTPEPYKLTAPELRKQKTTQQQQQLTEEACNTKERNKQTNQAKKKTISYVYSTGKQVPSSF